MPSSLTDARAKAIVASLRTGASITGACTAAGVPRQAYCRWLSRADDPDADPRYARFRTAAERARGLAENEAVDIIRAAALTDWRAAAWFLAHGRRTDWADNQKVEHSADGSFLEMLGGIEAAMGITDDESPPGLG
jgi:hypothetical protein